jgi:hypothetical protein
MTTWVKEVEGQLKYAEASEFPGIPNPFTHEAKCRDKGYMPLVGTPEDRPGYEPVPATWHKEEHYETRDVPQQVIVEDWSEPDPETGERHKTGEHTEIQIKPKTFDISWMQVDSYDYIPIEPPAPEPLRRQFSKGDLLEALMALNLYDAAKAIYAADLDLQIAWAGFASIDMDYQACADIMRKYPDLFTPANVEMLQRYITYGEVPNQQ